MTNPDDNAFQEGAFARTNTLTKREYFASQAMAGFCRNMNVYSDSDISIGAEMSVKYADMLIEELNKESK